RHSRGEGRNCAFISNRTTPLVSARPLVAVVAHRASGSRPLCTSHPKLFYHFRVHPFRSLRFCRNHQASSKHFTSEIALPRALTSMLVDPYVGLATRRKNPGTPDLKAFRRGSRQHNAERFQRRFSR